MSLLAFIFFYVCNFYFFRDNSATSLIYARIRHHLTLSFLLTVTPLCCKQRHADHSICLLYDFPFLNLFSAFVFSSSWHLTKWLMGGKTKPQIQHLIHQILKLSRTNIFYCLRSFYFFRVGVLICYQSKNSFTFSLWF